MSEFDERRFERHLAERSGSGDRRVLVLDPQAAGALLCRRLCAGHRGRGEGATAALDVAVALRGGGISLLRRAGPRRALRLRVRPTERQQHLEALAAHHRQLADLGGELPGEFREPRRAGRRGDRPHRRPRARRRCASTNRPSARPAPTALSTTRRSPTNSPRASTRRAASRRLRMLYLRNARYGYLRWGADGKVRQLDAALSAPSGGRASARSDEHDRGAGRAPRPRDRDQGVAGRLGRDRPGEAASTRSCAPRSSRRAPSAAC